MPYPLADIRVLDLTRLAPGPYATMILGDLGAEVIKIEEPSLGDYVRWRKPYLKNIQDENENLYFISLNRNKKSLKLDLKMPTGQEIFYKLVHNADVLIESFRPGVAARLKINYPTLKELNPRLIYCSLTGYGQDGPYALHPGHDINYIGITGLGLMTGSRDSVPVPMGTQVADFGGAMSAVISILVALLDRERTQLGQQVDVAMFETVISWMTGLYSDYFSTGTLPKTGIERLTGGLPSYSIYETKDGKYVALGSLEQKFWSSLCHALELDEWAEKNPSDIQDREPMFEKLRSIISRFTRDDLLTRLKDVDTCISPILSLEESLNNEQVQHREVFFEYNHPRVGKIRQIRTPFKFSRSQTGILRPSPAFGEHSEEILRDLGYSDSEIERFKENKII